MIATEAVARCRTPNCQMTEVSVPDKPYVMFSGTFIARVLVLAAYLLAAVFPILFANAGMQLPAVQHAQMMASAGHTMPMEDAGMSDKDAGMSLCQQHCLLAAATLPTQVPAVESSVVMSGLVLTADWLETSLATPPPGPPPKVAAI